ncbi:substrate-binding domain-containing protein [Nannocystis bainbridge]|uniref:Substrate-binding domain-containing protein n=1 Tax=Nannocystis bainbridge TaxID=2995303 RepID=A0ABT5DRZ7_9BACT|nr:substrate-binding domain-containing protein [Nannocystis bainbridge]MDC0716427.1 substrate-binding domain-containing protein [Nannocystis bainbridge]
METAIRIGLALALSFLVVALFRLGRRKPASRKDPVRRRGWSSILGNALFLGALWVVVGVIAAFMALGGNLVDAVPPVAELVEVRDELGEAPIECGPPGPRGQPTLVEVIHSIDQGPWLTQAASAFMEECPNVQLQLTARDDFDAASAILRGELRPTLWAPAEELSLRYLEIRWGEQSSESLFRIDERRPLVRSPLVALLHEEQFRALQAIREADRDGVGFWVDALCPTIPRAPALEDVLQEDMLPGTWIDWYLQRKPAQPAPPVVTKKGRAAAAVPSKPAAPTIPTPDALRSWGRVKLGFPAPTSSAGGIATLSLMARQHLLAGGAGDLAPALEREGEVLQRWLRRCNAGRDDWFASAILLTDHVFDLGPKSYDGVITYESLVFPILGRLQSEHLGEVRVYYPPTTYVAEHPAVLMWPDDEMRARELEAAQHWLQYLESEAVQRSAVSYGLRPGRLDRPLSAFDLEKNPFLDLRRFGIELDPELSEPPRPDGSALRKLLELWRDATGRS